MSIRCCRDVLPAVRAGLCLVLAAAALPAVAIELNLPIACEPGRTCELQNHVDRDPGAGALDYACGTNTYDQHNGSDFRLPTLAAQRAGVAVLAAASGRVLRARDGVADVSVRDRGAAAVAGTECGNGLVIDHGEGWETQYCHMAQGSLAVRPGDQVKAGQTLGRVGLSGLTEYPHLHFTVRSQGKVIDPFSTAEGTCGAGESLWSAPARAALAHRTRVVLNTGFATQAVTNELIEAGELERARPDRRSPAFVSYARVINAKLGDVLSLSLRGPDGRVLAQNTSPPLDRDKAQWLLNAGRRAPQGGWPAGEYEATLAVRQQDGTTTEHAFKLIVE